MKKNKFAFEVPPAVRFFCLQIHCVGDVQVRKIIEICPYFELHTN